MKNARMQKLLPFYVLAMSVVGLAFLLTATLTSQMVIGRVRHGDVNAWNYGDFQFGLVWGTKQFNYGYGTRDEETYNVYEEYDQPGANIPLILTTLCSVCMATLFTLLSIVFALRHVWKALTSFSIEAPASPKDDHSDSASIPSKGSKGPPVDSKGLPEDDKILPEDDGDDDPRSRDVPWLLIWNSISAGFSIVAIAVYTSWFWVEIKDDDGSSNAEGFVQVEGDEAPRIGYSFWLLVTGAVLLLTNVVITFLDSQCRQTGKQGGKEAEAAPLPEVVSIDPLAEDAAPDPMANDRVDLLPTDVPADNLSGKGTINSQPEESPVKPTPDIETDDYIMPKEGSVEPGPDEETVDTQHKDAVVDLLSKDATIGSLPSDRVDLLPTGVTISSLPGETVGVHHVYAPAGLSHPGNEGVVSLSGGAVVDLLPEVEITDL